MKIHLTKKQKKDLYAVFLSAGLLILAVLVDHFLISRLQLGTVWGAVLSRAIYLPAFLVAGWNTLAQAGSNILRGQIFDENFLMSIASIAAIALGECTEGVAVMLFSLVGNIFESYAVGNARGAVAALAKLCPDEVNVLRNGEVKTVPSEQVSVGEIFVVGAGERIALDGTVVEGSAALDCSSMTGESLPVDVSVGSSVLSGTINTNGMLKIRADKTAACSGAARTMAMVEDAALRKSKTEAFITKFALWYTPCVVVIALLFGVIGCILDPASWHTWIYRALSFLVVSCPCAIVISVPLTFFGSVGGAAKMGILFKDNSKLETLSKVKNIAFDKTGTLTVGKPVIDAIVPVGKSREELLFYAASAELSSTHPLSLAILEAYGQKVEEDRISELLEIPGKGRRALVDQKVVGVGNRKLLEELSVSIPDDCQPETTCVYVAVDGCFAGYFTFTDQIKDSSKAAIQSLTDSGIRTVMLSGDSERGASAVAQKLGMTEWHGSLLPEEKLTILEKLIQQDVTAFVGDGINDSPALARADIGFAMGTGGSDAAVAAADVVLVGDDPLNVGKALRISKKTVRVANQNILFSLAVKILIMILCALGLASMWLAVVGDVGVCVLAILNSMRTLERKN
jgi:Cd2+/Zn2+-exporting ATPase